MEKQLNYMRLLAPFCKIYRYDFYKNYMKYCDIKAVKINPINRRLNLA